MLFSERPLKYQSSQTNKQTVFSSEILRTMQERIVIYLRKLLYVDASNVIP